MALIQSKHIPTISQGKAISFDKIIIRYKVSTGLEATVYPNFTIKIANQSDASSGFVFTEDKVLNSVDGEEICEKIINLGMNHSLGMYWELENGVGTDEIRLKKLYGIVAVTNGGTEVDLYAPATDGALYDSAFYGWDSYSPPEEEED